MVPLTTSCDKSENAWLIHFKIEFMSVVLALFMLEVVTSESSVESSVNQITVKPWILLNQAAPCQSHPEAPWEPQWLPVPAAASSALGQRLAL